MRRLMTLANLGLLLLVLIACSACGSAGGAYGPSAGSGSGVASLSPAGDAPARASDPASGPSATSPNPPGQAPDAPTLEPLLTWLIEHLDRSVDVEAMARRAHMAPRTFARRFRAETGTTPHDWLTGQRVLLARRLLEETDLGIDAVAARAGFSDAAMLRHHFSRRVGATPQGYRATFRDRSADRRAA